MDKLTNDNYSKVFGPKAIIGMIHMAGDKPVDRALEELALLEREGVDGAIVENYHTRDLNLIEAVLKVTSVSSFKMAIGVNILPNNFSHAMNLVQRYNGKFIQLDYISGTYARGDHLLELDVAAYTDAKNKYPNIVVLGGVWPKYYELRRFDEKNLPHYLDDATKRAEAVVVTGDGTGEETPLSKIQLFRDTIDRHPLIVGAGLNAKNAYAQLNIADGAIVGSYFKDGDTEMPMIQERVKEIMDIAKSLR